MDICDFCGFGSSGINRDDLAAACFCGLNGFPPTQGLSPNVGSHNHVDLGVFRRCGTVVRLSEVELFSHHAAGAASGRGFRGPSGRVEITSQTINRGSRFFRVACIEHDGFGTVFLFGGEHVGSDGLVSLIPGNTNPARIFCAFGGRTLHRIKQTIRVIQALQSAHAFRAEPVTRIFFPVLNTDDVIALCLELNSAGRYMVARIANGKARPFLRLGICSLCKNGSGRRDGRKSGDCLENLPS
ncbi:unknown [Proteobacteria bacterium CAG:139]|nr:unknown [Proteobacteria bacterium CAG:139]